MYAHQWRMIGGKVKEEEKAYEAALRELREETRLSPVQFWTLPSVNTFYEHQQDIVHQIPAFGAEIEPSTRIKLNHEHSEYNWISEKEIESYISWPEQRRLMKLLSKLVTQNEILDDWIIEYKK